MSSYIKDMNNLNLARIASGVIKTKDELQKIVDEFKVSKQRNNTIISKNYYKNENDIMNKKRYYNDGFGNVHELSNKPNSKLSHNYHRLLIDLDINYALGHIPTLSGLENDYELLKDTVEIQTLYKQLREWAKEAEHGGVAWMYPFIINGKLKFKVLPSEQILAFTDEMTGEVKQVYRIFKSQGIDKIVIYEVEGYTTYIKAESGYVLDTTVQNPTPYITSTNTATGEISANNWGRIPLIPLRLNSEEIPSIIAYKELIDDYDRISSDISDAIRDHSFETFAITGANLGEDPKRLSTFTRNIKNTGVICVPANGSITNLEHDIATESAEIHLKRLNRDIFINAMSVDMTKEEFGNLSGVALSYMYQRLDLKINAFEIEIKESFKQLIEIINVYRQLFNQEPIKDLNITFNRSTLVNELEKVQTISASQMSFRTKLENNPLVEDVDRELERIEEENQAMVRLTLDEE